MVSGFRKDHAPTTSASGYYANQPNPFNLTSRIAMRERKKMYERMMRTIATTPDTTVLDVGVTSDLRPESNFFEKWYPHKNRITATGLEDASFLEAEYPGLKYVKSDGTTLPFEDRKFDVVVSFAVLEHVGSHDKQRQFVHELCRVGKRVYLTTPNRWFPIEYHTALPFLHWMSPPRYRKLLRSIGRDFYADENHLNLLGGSDVRAMFPSNARVSTDHHRMCGWISHLIFTAEII
ncbi:MAG: hypothetical protein H6Q90_2986 [Deltaproteobacteria bacterium]|nr:hypothetical protein [Deltaproteobacteria bacterium]